MQNHYKKLLKICKGGPLLTVSTILLSISLVLGMSVLLAGKTNANVDSSSYTIKGETVVVPVGETESSSFGIVGDMNPFSDLGDSTSYTQEIGYNPRIRANTPYPPTLSNPSSYYSKLKIVLDTSGNPTDTLYAIAVSKDSWTTTEYVQSDGTVGAALGIEDYKTYTSWGGASGSYILGLETDTEYKVKAKALQGNYTETGYSASTAGVSTVVPTINFALSTGAAAIGTMTVSAVSAASAVDITINTNAESGYTSYIKGTGNGANGGLYDGSSNIILSGDATLSAGTEGYGAQASSGTATIAAKYDVAGDQVGVLELSNNQLSSNTTQVTDEVVSVTYKAAISATTAAGGYSDTVYYTITPIL
jgi:hypothetical protein